MKTYKDILQAVEYIKSQNSLKPTIGIVLGSGLGLFANKIQDPIAIPYSQIPHFLSTTVEGHSGQLVMGHVGDIPVVALQGRIHYYEGHDLDQVTFPTRVLCGLGIHTLIITNAAGGLNPAFRESDIMLMTDHINFMGHNPLRGPNLKELGPRFPDMTEIYDKRCQDILRRTAEKKNLDLKEGVYVAISGPSYETPAEVRMLRLIGGDAVGMSTAPEAIVAAHQGVRVIGLSCIANLAAGMTSQKLTHAEVVTNAGRAVNKLLTLIEESIPQLAQV